MALTHEKLGHTDQGLWHHKGLQLPAFIQHVAKDLATERGMPMSQAIATAISQCEKWAAGGPGVKPETRAKAAAAVAEWDALKAKTKASRSEPMSRSEIMRFYDVDDIHIMRTAEGDGSGRVVEAYAAVFNDAVPIQDHEGHYEEEIDPHAFNATLTRIGGRRGGIASAVRVLYNHGRTMGGSEAAAFQKPLGKPLEIVPDSRGLLTRTEYAKTPHAEEILELIRGGSITAQSFVGGIIRSDPELRGPGSKHRARNGVLTRVRRLGLGLREYGPVLYAAYPGAEVLGVRMGSPDDFTEPGDEEFVPAPDPEDLDPAGGDDAARTREEVHPSRQHAHQLLVFRTETAMREAGMRTRERGWQ